MLCFANSPLIATYLTQAIRIIYSAIHFICFNRVSEAVMSQQNVFARNFLLKMKIQLTEFFSAISQHKHMIY